MEKEELDVKVREGELADINIVMCVPLAFDHAAQSYFIFSLPYLFAVLISNFNHKKSIVALCYFLSV